MKIGFIGLGIMGEAMCANIIAKHKDPVYVYDLMCEKVELMVQKGAIRCGSAREVAECSEVLISMVPESEHSQALYKEVLPALGAGKLCIDMSTIDPKISIEISEWVKATGAEFIDAPVVKSRPAAEAGLLGIYVGGSEKAYDMAKPILTYMGSNIIRMGDNGKGLVMKICHNTLVAQIQNGVNETITLARKNNISIDDYVTAISYGGGQNFYLDSKAKTIQENNYSVAFSVKNMNKDLSICMALAEDSNCEMPGTANAKAVYAKAMEMGYGQEDFSATIKVMQ